MQRLPKSYAVLDLHFIAMPPEAMRSGSTPERTDIPQFPTILENSRKLRAILKQAGIEPDDFLKS